MDQTEFESELNESVTPNNVDESVQEDSQESQEEETTEPTNNTEEEQQKEKLVQLPLSRVKYIMKTDPEIDKVTSEAVFTITKSTELFIDSLVKEAYRYTAQKKKKTVQKQDIISAIDNVDCLVFLDGIFK